MKSLIRPVRAYTELKQAQQWLNQYRNQKPIFACVLGFTETALIPGISAAGATPADRLYTAIADAEFLVNGPLVAPRYPLPPLSQGISPVYISRAVLAGLEIPIWLFNAGLPTPPAVPAIDLGGQPARCLSTGQAMPLQLVKRLFQAGYQWGEQLGAIANSYVILSECVVGGTTTALAILAGLGMAAQGKVNSSHPVCNHGQKWALVQEALAYLPPRPDPWQLLATVGDPMQAVVAGQLLAASQYGGVLLAGGTQMLAVYALARALANHEQLAWSPAQVVVGTTRWVAEDPTADTPGLAELVGQVPLLATQLQFTDARFPQLQMYEQGYVKEGVGAGGCAIAAELYQNWSHAQLMIAIEHLIDGAES